MDVLSSLLSQPKSNRTAVGDALSEARKRTWELADGASDEILQTAAQSYLSPPVWDLGHIANFEELWLVQTLQQAGEMHAGDNDTYNAFQHPREDRPNLPLLDRHGVRAYMEEVRAATLDGLAKLPAQGTRLLQDYFAYWMLVLHEHQHQETLLQSFVLRREHYTPTRHWPTPTPAPQSQEKQPWCPIPAGAFTMGRTHESAVYDNEAPAHQIHVPAFELARYPVTNRAWQHFLDAGGYEQEWLWSERGHDWLLETPHRAPMHWRRKGKHWERWHPALGWEDVRSVAHEIVCHVSYFEAEAYAKWHGARLPTEVEWEKACRSQGEGRQTLNPWGNEPADTRLANIDQFSWSPSFVGAYPDGAAGYGPEHMIGDVWEWTQSGFEAYPGFSAFPYDEYSKVFFAGDWKVLRGGAWSARAGCATGTFRNWDHPYRRQIMSGVRLARDSV